MITSRWSLDIVDKPDALACRASMETVKSISNGGHSNSKWERKWREMVSHRNRAQLARIQVKRILESRAPVEGNKEAFQVIFKAQVLANAKESKIRQIKIHLHNVAIRQREAILELDELQEREDELTGTGNLTELLGQLFPAVARLQTNGIQDIHILDQLNREQLLEHARDFCENCDSGTSKIAKCLLRTMKRRSELLTIIIELETSMKSMMEHLGVERIKGNPFVDNYLTFLAKSQAWFPYAYALTSNTLINRRNRSKNSPAFYDKQFSGLLPLTHQDNPVSTKEMTTSRHYERQYQDISLKSLSVNAKQQCSQNLQDKLFSQNMIDDKQKQRLSKAESPMPTATFHDSNKTLKDTKLLVDSLHFEEEDKDPQNFSQTTDSLFFGNKHTEQTTLHIPVEYPAPCEQFSQVEENLCVSSSLSTMDTQNYANSPAESLDLSKSRQSWGLRPQWTSKGSIQISNGQLAHSPQIVGNSQFLNSNPFYGNSTGHQFTQQRSNDDDKNVHQTPYVRSLMPHFTGSLEVTSRKEMDSTPLMEKFKNGTLQYVQDNRVYYGFLNDSKSHMQTPDSHKAHEKTYSQASEGFLSQNMINNGTLHIMPRVSSQFQSDMTKVSRTSSPYTVSLAQFNCPATFAQRPLMNVTATTLHEKRHIKVDTQLGYPYQLYLNKVSSKMQQELPTSTAGTGCSLFPRALKSVKQTEKPCEPSHNIFSFFSGRTNQVPANRTSRFYCTS